MDSDHSAARHAARSTLVVALTFLACTSSRADEDQERQPAPPPVKIGIATSSPRSIQSDDEWEFLANDLQKAIPDRQFLSVMLTENEAIRQGAEGQLDFALLGPSAVVRAEKRLGTRPIATMVRVFGPYKTPWVGATIVVRRDNERIKSLADLKGATFATSGKTFVELQVPLREIREQGVEPRGDFESFRVEQGAAIRAIESVLRGELDAAAVRAEIFRRFQRRAPGSANQLRILGERNFPDYPFNVSTRLYPGLSLVAMPRTPPELVAAVEKALLETPPPGDLKSSVAAGWIEPLDHAEVDRLLLGWQDDVATREGVDLSTTTTLPRRKTSIDTSTTTQQRPIERTVGGENIFASPWTFYVSAPLFLIGLTIFMYFMLRTNRRLRSLQTTLELELTQRNAAAAALRRSEHRLQMALDAAKLGTWTWNIETNEVTFDDRWYQMIGYDPVAMPASYEMWRRLVHPEDIERVEGILAKSINGQFSTYRTEMRLKSGEGAWKWILTSGETVEWSRSGRASLMAGVHVDIDETKRASTALAVAKESAETANRAKSEFLANMSHEIRTPMTSILGFAELLLDRSTSEEERDEAILTIMRNGRHLMAILNDILDISKIEAGQLLLENVRFSPIAIVDDVASSMRVKALEKGLEFEVVQEPPIPEEIEGDPTRLRQILLNLIGNAIKFTERGKVRVTMRLFPGDPEKLEITVSDTGVGMNQETVDQLFEPFRQADASTTRRFGGTGLGLSIARHLAKRLGGTINVTSEPGKGSTFSLVIRTGMGTMSLGASQTDATPAADERPATDATLKDSRILLVEDGEDNQRLIRSLLARRGCEVTIAANGKVAYELALAAEHEGKPFHVVLMDMQMPVMDGYEATRKLRAKGFGRPIIALTADAMAGARERCIRVGCADYASKPIDKVRLLELVRASITRREMAEP
ncbi:Autoinducer 2 sensor kinase/phosphatase LuxQ [Planctomycetes bacterium Pan216]|uniref:histidine kinase n=1 Tax=Kolteria novifilia TaxID=2527975 RepID=A0A518B1J7_9BACT|nr:Autoinducer 2 sensor kinase/phosphatase LuxQ [Planctomycetes bacterium Pan216]